MWVDPQIHYYLEPRELICNFYAEQPIFVSVMRDVVKKIKSTHITIYNYIAVKKNELIDQLT